MRRYSVAGLLVGIAAAAPVAANEHRVRIDHHAGPVEAVYRADVSIDHRQVGAVTPGGRPSTLRCLWTAGVTVDRQARHGSGQVMTRSISRDNVVGGSRHGWCDAQRQAIAQEVAQRTDRVRQEMMAIADEDHSVLRAELDSLHADRRAG